MLTLQLREIDAALSGAVEMPYMAGISTVDAYTWVESSFDLQRGLEVVELGGSAPVLPVDPADLQAR